MRWIERHCVALINGSLLAAIERTGAARVRVFRTPPVPTE